jgi:hypothetical protein
MLELPHPSTAIQVLVVVFAHELPPVTSGPSCCTVTVLHASLAVGGSERWRCCTLYRCNQLLLFQ